MEPSIFRYILRYTLKDQILILLITAISLPLVYVSLEVPKMIINDAIGGADIPESLFGYPVDQLSYLMILCFTFLLLVLINGAIKYVLNVYRGVVGERMLRRLRYDLFTRILRFPRAHMKTISQGETIPIITAETEPLGGFIGEAFALPAFQGGILLTYLFFIFNQDFLLGLVATALYPFQLYIIPKLQRRVNALGKRRVLAARQLGDRIGEVISGMDEIRANDTGNYERAVISERLGNIFGIRFEIYKKKFFIKFLNNFLAQVTPFFFYLFGGYYIITGQLSLGALVAVLAAYKDLNAPWKELLKYYQTKEDVRIKYEQIIEQFNPGEMLTEQPLDQEPLKLNQHADGWNANNLSYAEQEGIQLLERLSFRVDLSAHTAIVGSGDSGKEELGHLLMGLAYPSQGRLSLSGQEIQKLPRHILGRNLAHVGANAHVFSGSIRSNLEYALRHQQLDGNAVKSEEQRQRMKDARLAGNSVEDPGGDWIALSEKGDADQATLIETMLDALEVVDLHKDIFQFGLFGKIKNVDGYLPGKVLEARLRIAEQLRSESFVGLVELFDDTTYNRSISVLENILFSPIGETQQQRDALAGNKILQQFLRQQGLLKDFVNIGRELTGIMIDVFSDIDTDSDLFERFSFIQADRLPEYQELLNKTRDKEPDLRDSELVERYLRLTFQLTPGRHRLGLIDEPIQQRIVLARQALAREKPDLGIPLRFFNRQEFHPDLNLLDNMLYGKLVYGQARAEEKVTELIHEVVETLQLKRTIIEAGLDYDVGSTGKRLSIAQRQKLAIARGLMKKPLVTILNGATSALDPAAEQQLLRNLRTRLKEFGLVYITGQALLTQGFDYLFVLENGRLVEQGRFDDLQSMGGKLSRLLS